MKPTVSIITPTYNHQKFIATCIESVLKQTYKNWEMIIIDDGSDDKTPDIIKQFKDSRIQYIRQEHLGAYKLGIIYNKALALARGELVAILEGDDYWATNKLEIQIPYFKDERVILAYGECMLVDKNNKVISHQRIRFPNEIRQNQPVGTALQIFVKLAFFIFSPTVLVRKSTLNQMGGFIQPPYLPLVDSCTWTRFALEGEFKYIHQPLGFYRRTPKSLSIQKEVNILKGHIRYIQDFLITNNDRIRKLGLNINREELKNFHRKLLNDFVKLYHYGHAYIFLTFNEKKDARKYFFQYLKSKQKRLLYCLASLCGIISSYIGINLIGQMLKIKYSLFSGFGQEE